MNSVDGVSAALRRADAQTRVATVAAVGVWVVLYAAVVGVAVWLLPSVLAAAVGLAVLVAVAGAALVAGFRLRTYARAARRLVADERTFPVTAQTQPVLYGMLGRAAGRLGVAVPAAVLVSEKVPWLCTVRAGRRRCVVVVTSGWLSTASASQTSGALAHEVAHVAAGEVGWWLLSSPVPRGRSAPARKGGALVAAAVWQVLAAPVTSVARVRARFSERGADLRAVVGCASALDVLDAVNEWTLLSQSDALEFRYRSDGPLFVCGAVPHAQRGRRVRRVGTLFDVQRTPFPEVGG